MSKLLNAIKELERRTDQTTVINNFKTKKRNKTNRRLILLILTLGCITIIFIGALHSNNHKTQAKRKDIKVASKTLISKNSNISNKSKKKIEKVSLKEATNKKAKIANRKKKRYRTAQKTKNERLKKKKTARREKRIQNKKMGPKIEQEGSKKVSAKLLAAEEYRKKGFYQKAIVAYKRALSEEDEETRIYILNNIGALYLLKNEPLKALKYLRESYNLRRDKNTSRNLIIAYIQLGKTKEACTLATKEGLIEIKQKLGCR